MSEDDDNSSEDRMNLSEGIDDSSDHDSEDSHSENPDEVIRQTTEIHEYSNPDINISNFDIQDSAQVQQAQTVLLQGL